MTVGFFTVDATFPAGKMGQCIAFSCPMEAAIKKHGTASLRGSACLYVHDEMQNPMGSILCPSTLMGWRQAGAVAKVEGPAESPKPYHKGSLPGEELTPANGSSRNLR
jgi:hypothetical protein